MRPSFEPWTVWERPPVPKRYPTSGYYPWGPATARRRTRRIVWELRGRWVMCAQRPIQRLRRPYGVPRRTCWTPTVERRRRSERRRSKCHGTPKESMSKRCKTILRSAWRTRKDASGSRSGRLRSVSAFRGHPLPVGSFRPRLVARFSVMWNKWSTCHWLHAL